MKKYSSPFHLLVWCIDRCPSRCFSLRTSERSNDIPMILLVYDVASMLPQGRRFPDGVRDIDAPI